MVSAFWLSSIMMVLDICVKAFVETYISSLLGFYLALILLSEIVTLYLVFLGTPKLLSKVLHIFAFPLAVSEYSNSSHPHQHYCLFFFLILVILVKWHHIIALISSFFMTTNIKHVFMCSWTFAYFLWRSVYANILHIFNWAAFSNEF